jgi:putative membrane protein
MDPTRALPLLIHIVGFVVWLGSLFSMARTLAARDIETDEAFRTRLGALARAEGLRADVGATTAIVGGLWLLSSAPGFYLHQPWMHAKLTLVVAVLGVHGFLRVKAKRASMGEGRFPRAVLSILWVVAISIIALVVFRPGAK